MKTINKIFLTILICCGSYSYVAAQCAASCADIMAGAPADCGAVVNPASAGIPPGSTAQPEFGGDGSAAGCQEYVDVTDFSPIPGAPPAPGPGSILTLCSSWTPTSPAAFFPNFEGVVTAMGATACFAEQTVTVSDAATCAPAGTVTQPVAATATAGQVTGLTVGTTYVVCTTYDYTNATDMDGAPCTPDPAQLTAEICTEIVEASPPCDSVVEPQPIEVCAGSAFQIVVDAGACSTYTEFDDPQIAGGLSGYAAVYFFDGTNFANCPAGSTGSDILNMPGDIAAGTPGFIFFGETNVAGGGGCAPIDIGAFNNPTCEPANIPICIVNIDVNGFIIETADGQSCAVAETIVTVNPIFETVEDISVGCNPIAGVFVSDGMGGFFDQDGDGALTFADACMTAQLDPTAECTDGEMLDYDFTAVDVGACSGDLTGTLTCDCPPVPCSSTYTFTAPAEVCNGAAIDFTVDAACDVSLNTIDFGNGVGVDPSLNLDFYIYLPGGVPSMAPPGTVIIPADIDGGATGNPDITFLGTAGTATALGNGCGDFQFAAGQLLNATCDPIVVSFFVVPFTFDQDTDGDGTFGAYLADGNEEACPVLQYDVTINPILGVLEDTSVGCDPIAGAFAADGMGNFFDTDGDGALTFADACMTAQLDPTADCTDGEMLDYDFSALDVGACSGDLTGTLTCVCVDAPCTGEVDYPDIEVCQVADATAAVFSPVTCTINPEVVNADSTITVIGFDIYSPDQAAGTYLGSLFESATFGAAACDDLTVNLPDNLTCNPLLYQFEIVTSINEFMADGTFISAVDDGNCTSEIMTVTQYPILTAAAVDGVCPDDIIATLTAEDATECATESQTCVADGPLNFDFSATFTDPLACSTLTATANCSGCAGVCSITPDAATNIVCNDNNTPGDPSDDTYTFDILVNGSNTDAAASNTFNDDQANLGIAYGTLVSYGPFPISGGPITVTFTDADDAMCTGMMMATPPATCSMAAMCTITPDAATNIVCNDNNTPGDPSDDTYTFDILVNGSNTDAAASNTFNDDQANSGIAYGTLVSYGPFPISGGPITVTFTDADDAMCTGMMMATPPATCSGAVCEIEVIISNILCDPGADPQDPADDTFTFDYTVNDIGGTGTTWSSDNGDAGVAYGTTISGNMAGSVSTFTIIVTDDADAGCTATDTAVFGDCATPAIPTLSQWGLMSLALLLMIFGAVKLSSVSLSTSRKK